MSLKIHGWIGLGVIGVAEVLLFKEIPVVKTFFTPIVWSGYILFIDSLLFRNRGASWLMNRRKEFLLLLFLSIGFWLIFEFYNLFIQNWHYRGLPDEIVWRWFGYAWAFATIWPAILLTAEVLVDWRFLQRLKTKPWPILRIHRAFLLVLGAFCLLVPFLVSPKTATYLAAPVWLGFIFFLEPLNYGWGGRSLLRDLEKGEPRILYGLLLSGIICGFLWEFWNYWAGARWIYTVPLVGKVRIFEMPVLGYLGFPAFALECYVMVEFVKNIFRRSS